MAYNRIDVEATRDVDWIKVQTYPGFRELVDLHGEEVVKAIYNQGWADGALSALEILDKRSTK